MSRSWGHTIRLLTEDEVERNRVYVEKYGRRWHTCTGKCQEDAVYATGYLYVTGRAGRVSSAERFACVEHGRKFAAKHGLELPVEKSERTSRTGYMAVEEAIRGL